MSPQQEFFTACRGALRELYPDQVYDTVLPPPGTAYPFIYLSTTMEEPQPTKHGMIGYVTQIFKVFNDNPKKRGTFSAMAEAVVTTVGNIENTSGYHWRVETISTDIRPDPTTTPPLQMATITVRAQFS